MGLVAPRHVESSRTGIEPLFPALVGIFLTTVLPGNILDETLFSLNLEFRFLILCMTE